MRVQWISRLGTSGYDREIPDADDVTLLEDCLLVHYDGEGDGYGRCREISYKDVQTILLTVDGFQIVVSSMKMDKLS